MAVTMPEGTLGERLERYLEGFGNRHGLEESGIEDGVVNLTVSPESVPAVLATAREDLNIRHLSYLTVVDRQGFFEITYALADLRGADVRVKTTIQGEEPVIGTVTHVYPTANWHEAGGVRHVRGRVRGASRLAADVHVAGPLRPPPAFEELRDKRPPDLRRVAIAMLREEKNLGSQSLGGTEGGRLTNPDIRDEFGLETLDMNMGPQHPAMHGLLRLILELDGETVVRCDPVMGYLHRCQEKIAENRMYPAVIPLTDRLDYFANIHNEHGYCLAVEDLLDVEIPPRAEYIRVLMSELMRLASHIPSLGFLMLELGAFTPILYGFRERERIQTLFEAITGARMMFHYVRIGGVKADLPPDIPQRIWDYIESLEANYQSDFVDLVQGNEIFISRTRNVGRMSPDKALDMGLTGPPLRCTGVDFDIRRDYPYSIYNELDFDVITEDAGDVEASYKVRVREILESIKLIKQCLEKLPEGEVMGDTGRRIRPAEGEGFSRIESPRGEFSVHVVSDGTDTPYRVHYRDPSFCNMQLLQEIVPGHYLPDIMPIMGLIDPVSGGWDK